MPSGPYDVRPAGPADFTQIHELNREAVPAVSDVTREALEHLAGQGTCLVVARDEAASSVVRAFLILLGPGVDYPSPNYQFFRDRHPDFAYVDRIVVAPPERSQGLGGVLYAAAARTQAPVLCAEVNVRPPNEGSLRFHDRQGFAAVGEQDTEGGAKRVVMLEKRLRAAAPR